ncbi:MAG: DUF192 domain-containing protein [Thermodesulfobacteriota bacterium]
MQNLYKLSLFVILILIGTAYFDRAYSGAVRGRINLFDKEGTIVQVDVEIADTPKNRGRGLMFRKELGQEEGMFFIFDAEDIRVFWMKNTLIPLDMIFISRDFRIVSFIKGARPCKQTPCMNYRSKGPAMYVLEVNAGFIDKYGIDKGTSVEFLPGKGQY